MLLIPPQSASYVSHTCDRHTLFAVDGALTPPTPRLQGTGIQLGRGLRTGPQGPSEGTAEPGLASGASREGAGPLWGHEEGASWIPVPCCAWKHLHLLIKY